MNVRNHINLIGTAEEIISNKINNHDELRVIVQFSVKREPRTSYNEIEFDHFWVTFMEEKATEFLTAYKKSKKAQIALSGELRSSSESSKGSYPFGLVLVDDFKII